MKVEYSSNNSGGSWWLTNDHWLALEKAGWTVVWGGHDFCHDTFRYGAEKKVAPDICPQEERDGRSWNTCEGHQRFSSLDEALAEGYEWLGSQAQEAWGEFPSLKDAIESWEAATGLDASENGCGCCGPPHSFSSGTEYASGEEVAGVLYPAVKGRSLRELAKELAK